MRLDGAHQSIELIFGTLSIEVFHGRFEIAGRILVRQESVDSNEQAVVMGFLECNPQQVTETEIKVNHDPTRSAHV